MKRIDFPERGCVSEVQKRSPIRTSKDEGSVPMKRKTAKVTEPLCLWTIADVAAFLKIHRNSVLALRKRGELKAVTVLGNQIRFRKEDIDSYVNSQLDKDNS